MTKREFASAIRAWAWREPTAEEWQTMWMVHESKPDESVMRIVKIHIKPRKPDTTENVKLVDNRKIPEEHRLLALSLEDLAEFARQMQLKFK